MRRRTLLACTGALAAACGGAPTPSPPPPPVEQRPVAPAPAPPPATQLPVPTVVKLENGLTAAVTQAAPGHDALLQFGFFAGALFMAPGAAELAMEVVVGDADPSQGRVALTQAIAQLGGTLAVRAGPATTWIDMRVPGNRWEEAVVALRRALEAPAQSRHQIERIRERTVAGRAAWIRRDPVAAMAQLLLLGESGAAGYLHALLDRDPSEINLFQARLHRPERAVLVIETPDDPAQAAAALGQSGSTALGGWSPPAAPPGAVPTLDRSFVPGLYWSPAPAGARDPETTRVALVLYLPNPGQLSATDMLLLHVCLTLDGTGGRLERLQRDHGLESVRWHSSVASTPDATAIVLTADVATSEVQPLWNVLQLARASLRDVPPTESELAIALRRAPLTARLAMLDDGGRLRTQAKLVLLGTTWADVDHRLQTLAAAPALDVRAATDAFLDLPVALVAVGGVVPDDATDVRRFELLPAGQDEQAAATAAQPAPATDAGAAWLQRAADAIGGAARIRRLTGWESDGKLVNDRAPAMTETCRWRTDGTLARTREILGQKIRTSLEGNVWFEQAGEITQSLNSREAALLRRELQRHPLALLATHARGELPFRPVAQREAGDRHVMVLEAVGEAFDRLRIHVDTGSHLIRVVETWETLPDGTVVHLQDRWSDYRSTAGLRAPFHRLTTQDDGQNRVETVFTRWVPELGAP